MPTSIRTQYFSNHHGAGRITARSRSLGQKTLPYDHAKSRYENHKAAAEALQGGPVEMVDEVERGFRFVAEVRGRGQTVTSLRTGQVYQLVEERGTKLLLDDGQTQFEAFRKNYTDGGDYVPGADSSDPRNLTVAWSGLPGAKF